MKKKNKLEKIRKGLAENPFDPQLDIDLAKLEKALFRSALTANGISASDYRETKKKLADKGRWLTCKPTERLAKVLHGLVVDLKDKAVQNFVLVVINEVLRELPEAVIEEFNRLGATNVFPVHYAYYLYTKRLTDKQRKQVERYFSRLNIKTMKDKIIISHFFGQGGMALHDFEKNPFDDDAFDD